MLAKSGIWRLYGIFGGYPLIAEKTVIFCCRQNNDGTRRDEMSAIIFRRRLASCDPMRVFSDNAYPVIPEGAK